MPSCIFVSDPNASAEIDKLSAENVQLIKDLAALDEKFAGGTITWNELVEAKRKLFAQIEKNKVKQKEIQDKYGVDPWAFYLRVALVAVTAFAGVAGKKWAGWKASTGIMVDTVHVKRKIQGATVEDVVADVRLINDKRINALAKKKPKISPD